MLRAFSHFLPSACRNRPTRRAFCPATSAQEGDPAFSGRLWDLSSCKTSYYTLYAPIEQRKAAKHLPRTGGFHRPYHSSASNRKFSRSMSGRTARPALVHLHPAFRIVCAMLFRPSAELHPVLPALQHVLFFHAIPHPSPTDGSDRCARRRPPRARPTQTTAKGGRQSPRTRRNAPARVPRSSL